MAIVEDEVRNESEEENEIGVILAEEEADVGDDPDDSEIESEEDEDEELILEKRVLRLESCIAKNPYNYDEHVELIQTLWGLSSLEPIPILSEWCSWALTVEPAEKAREQLDEVLRRAGADPFSGKIFWDAKLELEKTQLENLSEEDTEYKAQKERVLWCLEETVKRQHEFAVDFLHQISPFEDRLLTTEYAECDSNGILRVVYERASYECGACGAHVYRALATHVRTHSSRATYNRLLAALRRRVPTRALPWDLTMQQAEKEGESFEQIKTIFETALARGMESFSQSEELWLSYLEYLRRISDFNNEKDVDRLRRTFRLAWDTLAELVRVRGNVLAAPAHTDLEQEMLALFSSATSNSS
ncbi:hypothetical protein HF086_006754 [Spodoptera exigua]|uniref:Suppressor of forked domain-containing protein n=1 Tax=Spodoptera exigua TaxID=7107 RepID=A0A922M7A1_SPOEX|nr:hypothetical protein HF086_006754 [Spodoptera exigua]